MTENSELPEEDTHNHPLESTPTKSHTPDNDRDFTVSTIAHPSHGDTNGQIQEMQQSGGADDVFIDDNISNQKTDTIQTPTPVMNLSLPDDDNLSDRVTYERQVHTPPDNLHLLLHSNLAINNEGHKTTTPTSNTVLETATDSGLSQTDQRNQTCNSCNKSFKSISGFRSHERAAKRRGSCK